jgi:hypothetical protein
VSLDKNDSRKYKLALIALTLITLAWVVTSGISNLREIFPELVSGVMGILAIYYTGNVGNKFIVAKYLVDQAKVKSGENNVNPG